MKLRKVTRVVQGKPAVDGAGVRLNRVLGGSTIEDFDIKPQYVSLVEENGEFVKVISGEYEDVRTETTHHIQMKLLDDDEIMEASASMEKVLHIILVSAPPSHEPLAWGGPIVMNTREELQLAFDELRAGTFIK